MIKIMVMNMSCPEFISVSERESINLHRQLSSKTTKRLNDTAVKQIITNNKQEQNFK